MNRAQQRRARRAAVLASLRAEVESLREQSRKAREQRLRETEARRQEVANLATTTREQLEDEIKQPRLQRAKQEAKQRRDEAEHRHRAVKTFLTERQTTRRETSEAAASTRREQVSTRQRKATQLRVDARTECQRQWSSTQKRRTQALCQIYAWVEVLTGIHRRPPCGECEESEATSDSKHCVDNLQRIEGVGPKCATLLYQSGIATFAALAHTPCTRLQEILTAAGPRFRVIDPTTWPEQAQLAAQGKFDALDELQKKLVAGRRRKLE